MARAGSDRRATLLARLQDDILDRVVPAAPDPALRADGSLRGAALPGRAARARGGGGGDLARWCEADPTLRFNQIAVVVPESVKDSYLAHVAAVFGEAHELPHSVVDLPLRPATAWARRCDAAAGRCRSARFTRRELLPLLTHPR